MMAKIKKNKYVVEMLKLIVELLIFESFTNTSARA